MTLVVHIEPGPIPTFRASAPSSASFFAASAVPILPATTSAEGIGFLYFFQDPDHTFCMGMSSINDQ